MAGIYIPSMDFPKYGERVVISTDGHAYYEDMISPYRDLGSVYIVPPHGRLIDADALNYTRLYKENWMRGTGVEAPAVWKSDIDAAPTIIPAEEGE